MLRKEYLLRSTNVGPVKDNPYSVTENGSKDKERKDSDLRISSRKLHRVLFFLNLLKVSLHSVRLGLLARCLVPHDQHPDLHAIPWYRPIHLASISEPHLCGPPLDRALAS